MYSIKYDKQFTVVSRDILFASSGFESACNYRPNWQGESVHSNTICSTANKAWILMTSHEDQDQIDVMMTDSVRVLCTEEVENEPVQVPDDRK